MGFDLLESCSHFGFRSLSRSSILRKSSAAFEPPCVESRNIRSGFWFLVEGVLEFLGSDFKEYLLTF